MINFQHVPDSSNSRVSSDAPNQAFRVMQASDFLKASWGMTIGRKAGLALMAISMALPEVLD